MGKALLIIVAGFSVIFSGVVFNLTSSQSRSAQEIVIQHEKWIARNAAESAANVGIAKIYQDINDLSWSGLSGTFNDASYSITATNVTTDSINEAKRISILALTTFAEEADSSIAVLIEPAYSYYNFFTREWPNHRTFSTGDTLWGPLHTNDRIKISGTPVFISKVSSGNANFDPSGANPKCYGGAEMGATSISSPDLIPIRSEAGADEYNDGLTLTFNADGTYDYVSGALSGTKQISDYNGIIRTTNDEDIHVQGVVNGQVTVVSDQDIYIDNNIVYFDNPISNVNSDDFLGLVAKNDVIINKSGAVTIHAAILMKEIFRFPQKGSNAIKQPLIIVGSLGQRNEEDPTFLVIGGYQIKLIADPRLRSRTPPYFPRVTNRVEQVYRSK